MYFSAADNYFIENGFDKPIMYDNRFVYSNEKYKFILFRDMSDISYASKIIITFKDEEYLIDMIEDLEFFGVNKFKAAIDKFLIPKKSKFEEFYDTN